MEDSSISDAEWRVMDVLWSEAPLTAADIIDRLGPEVGWHPKTIRTMLHRLVKKGVLLFEQTANRYLYRPVAPRETFVRQASRSFLDRVFGGAAMPMLVHLVRNADLKPRDIESLKRLLDGTEDEQC